MSPFQINISTLAIHKACLLLCPPSLRSEHNPNPFKHSLHAQETYCTFIAFIKLYKKSSQIISMQSEFLPSAYDSLYFTQKVPHLPVSLPRIKVSLMDEALP